MDYKQNVKFYLTKQMKISIQAEVSKSQEGVVVQCLHTLMGTKCQKPSSSIWNWIKNNSWIQKNSSAAEWPNVIKLHLYFCYHFPTIHILKEGWAHQSGYTMPNPCVHAPYGLWLSIMFQNVHNELTNFTYRMSIKSWLWWTVSMEVEF